MDLEKYLIPDVDVATEGTKEILIEAGILALFCTALGLPRLFKSTRDAKRAYAEKMNDAKRSSEKHAKWVQSDEYRELSNYIMRTYGIDFSENISTSDRIQIHKKIDLSIISDINRLIGAFNKNASLRNKLADEYRKYAESLDLYFKDTEDEIRNDKLSLIKSSFVRRGQYKILDLSQDAILFLLPRIGEEFITVLNHKYSKEITLGLMTRFSVQGDGDEGLIGCEFQ